VNLKNILKRILVVLFDLESNRVYNSKINKIAGLLNIRGRKFDQEIIKRHTNKWNTLQKKINLNWFKVYSSVLKREEENFIPEDIYYSIVEPILNNKILSKAYSDKNFYSMLYNKNLFPATIIRNIDGNYCDEEYNRIDITEELLYKLLNNFSKIIIKPSIDSGGGHNVIVFIKKGDQFFGDNETLSTIYLKKRFDKNYIIQNYLIQHSFFSDFNPTSLNTIRVFTYRSVKDNKIHILHTILRVGKAGSHVDNQASGGISINISSEGLLNNFAIDKYGNKSYSVNGMELNGNINVLYIDLIKKIALEIAARNIHHRLLGLDFTVDQNENVRLIEINNQNNEINFYQMNSGSLFGKFTDEVIGYCMQNKKTFVLDFEV